MPITKAQLRDWRSDRKKAALELAKVVDRQTTRLIPFKFNRMQDDLDTFLDANTWAYILKSRQLGATTYLLWRAFHKALLTPNYKVAVVAHTYSSVLALFQTVHRYYDNLPDDLKALAPKAKSSAHALVFEHGGGLIVGTANSDAFRGQTHNQIIFDEFAFYQDADRAMAAILQTATPDAEVVLCTTANGLNFAHKLWFDTTAGYSKFFASWVNDPLARRKQAPSYLDPYVEVYKQDHGLSQEQTNWVAHHLSTACAGDWKLFNQEQPINAQVAFVATGERVLTKPYPHAKCQPGYARYAQPVPYHTYIMGIDPATGKPNGDFSAFVVLDITDGTPRIVSVYYKRASLTEFNEVALRECRKYNDALAVIEVNGPGPSTVEHFITSEYGNIYRRTTPLKVGGKPQDTMGFYTGPQTRPLMISRLRSHVDSGKVPLIDPNLQHEANSFIYNSSGREEADSGCHDDGLLALALALMGLDQTHHMSAPQYDKKPRGLEEILQWESATGEVYDPSRFDDWEEQETGVAGMSDVW